MTRPACRALAVLLAAAPLWGAAVARGDEPAETEATRATMDRIFASIRLLLPLSLDDARFADPAQRAGILAALDSLAADGAVLADHGGARDASFGFLSRSLARDARDIRDRYAAGHPAEARFLLLQLTDDCVACHSRLPSRGRDFPGGEAFVTREQIAALPLEQRAVLEMATRQFDRALASYEALFASPDPAPSSLDLEGYLDDYLELCIRVKNDPERPVHSFETLLARQDLSESLRANLESWIAALHALAAAPPQGPPIASAESLISAAEARSRYPGDRRALVEYVAASGVLQRYVASAQRSDPELGKAYYLLGVIESRTGRSLWLSQTEDFLETAIRLDPGRPWAPDAYDLLAEFVASGYSGSAGEHVPEDVQQRLDELHRLIETSQPAPAASAPTS
jgi:tetratricopeptide (TPR) repeat protein